MSGKDLYGNWFSWLIKALFAGCTAFVLLNLFSFFYSNQGAHITNPTGATDYTWQPHAWFSRMSEGYTFGRLDGSGFNNSYPAIGEDVDILLMGSSHMEAMQMPQNKNVGYLLNELLHAPGGTGDYVYNIGTSGHGLTDCISNLPAALNTYSPSRAVIIETMTLDFTEQQIRDVLDGTRSRIPSYDSGWVYSLQQVPYLKLLYSQFNSFLGEKQPQDVEHFPDDAADTRAPSAYADGISSLMKKAADPMGSCRLIIFYHPTLDIEDDGTAVPHTDPVKRRAFSAACQEHGIIFLDMTDLFLDAYRTEHILPHGFANTAVGTGHLNQSGHRMVAAELAKVIAEMEAAA